MFVTAVHPMFTNTGIVPPWLRSEGNTGTVPPWLSEEVIDDAVKALEDDSFAILPYPYA